jgi:hypothetical protein
MYNGDTVSSLISYTTIEYPDVDIRKSKKKFRQREYEKIIIEEVLTTCFDRMFDDVIDILEDYELVYEYLNSVYKNDIYKFQLNTIRKLLIFLRRR